jgi:hypothetical protein
MKIIIISTICSYISYNVGLYIGMKKGAKIAKKVYREFGVFLKQDI